MPHTTLPQTKGVLTDVQDTEMFDFLIPNIPEGGNERALAVLCQQAIYPGRSNEIIEVPIHGHQLHFRGRAVTPRQLQVTYVENHEMLVTKIFQKWFEYIAGTYTGTSQGYKREYTVDGALLQKFDTTGRVADVVSFFGLMPEDMPDVQLDGSSSNAYLVAVTFRYDWYIPRGVAYRQSSST